MLKAFTHLPCLIALLLQTVAFAADNIDPIYPISETLLNEPSCFVNGSVNVITGNYHEHTIDLEVAGPHPLTFQRSFINGYGWSSNHFGYVGTIKKPSGYYDGEGNYQTDLRRRVLMTYVTGDYFIGMPYIGKYLKKHEERPFNIEIESFEKFVTNSADSGCAPGSHIRNNRFWFLKGDTEYFLRTGDGFTRHYKGTKEHGRASLQSEDLPYGCSLRYSHESKSYYFTRIIDASLTDKKGQRLSRINFEYNDDELVRADDGIEGGKWVTYTKGERVTPQGNTPLLTVEGSDIPKRIYEYGQGSQKSRIVCKRLPDNRFLWTKYYKAGNNTDGAETLSLGFGDPRIGRVMIQKAPVGKSAKPVLTHRYVYNLRTHVDEFGAFALGGQTTVYDAYDYRTDYFFNDDYRITEIWKWKKGKQKVYSKERSFWGPNGTPNGTNLMSRTLENEYGQIKLCRSYLYDKNGNATHHFLWGNLTGKTTGEIVLNGSGIPMQRKCDCDVYAKVCAYSLGHPNLLVSERDCKKTIEYHYLPNTNLMTARLIKADNKIYKREFCGYDDNGCLTATVVDDGAYLRMNKCESVTERHITHIQNRAEAPIGLPQIVEEFYFDFDTNQKVLLGKVVNTHSSKGKLLSQEHYDSENNLRFTLEWAYDSKGNKIMEKDALGRVVNKKYDANGNLIYEEGPYSGVYKEFQYDFVNRLIGTREVHPDGVTLTWSYRYDLLGNKVASIDPYGQETRYVYDCHSRLIETILPVVLDENKVAIQPKICAEYDLLNNPRRITDASGNVTDIGYTAYNKPFCKIHPDGTKERMEYDLTGNLVMSRAQNGTKTHYQYDPFDRLIKKEVYAASGELLESESNTYNAFHLLSTTAPNGVTTHYEYDKAGRLVTTTTGEMRTEYQYDALGREVKVLAFYGTGKEDYTAKVKEYDLLNRVIEERTEDGSGNILIKEAYTYDPAGNCQVVSKWNQAGEALVSNEYNTRGQPILLTNASGGQTHIRYRYDYFDEELQQYLPCTESTDPHGIVTVSIQDALGRNKTEYKKDAFGKLLQRRHSYYTATGLIGRTVDEVIIDGVAEREVINLFSYNSAGKLIALCEAVNTPDQKITKFSYNKHGQKELETKPDGVVIHYEYDPLGHLKDYYASDDSFHYTFEYDAGHNPIRVVDSIHHTETLRTYDAHNRLKKETLANGLAVEYLYDLSGKLTRMTFPDGSGMTLSYESLFLKEVCRINKEGDKGYAHTYDAYDLSGNVLKSTLIGQAGTIDYTLDLQGRMTEVLAGSWKGSAQFDAVGNMGSKSTQDAAGLHDSTFTYDELNQLIKESGSIQEEYSYDSLYNRIRKGTSHYDLNPLNQITHDGRNRYTYDPNGNLMAITNDQAETKLYYDALNRLIKVEKEGCTVRYVYDEKNRRMSKSVSFSGDSQGSAAQSFRYFYQDLNEIGCYEGEQLIELRLLGIGKGAEIGAAIAVELNDIAYAPIHDIQGNVIALIEADTGNVKECYRYNAFGEERIYNGQGVLTDIAINPWRFSSKRTDPETGFVYFGRRYYDSNLGRWITPDPIGFEGGPNLYAYVFNNPLTHFDLYGLYAVASEGRNCFSMIRDAACAVFESVRDCVTSFCSAIRDGLSRCSERLSECFSSYREERQVRFNSKILGSPMNRRPAENIMVGSGKPACAGFTNGMCNTEKQNLSSAEILSKFAGGRQIESTVSPTNSWFHDLFRSFHSLFFCLASNGVFGLHEKWNKHFEQKGADAVWLETCHSEGAINVRNALMSYNPQLRKMIDVVAIAPGCYIDRELCRSVHHYVSTRDFVPWVDLVGRIRNRDTVHVLPAHKDASLWDHDFASPTYREVIKRHVEQHLKNKGY